MMNLTAYYTPVLEHYPLWIVFSILTLLFALLYFGMTTSFRIIIGLLLKKKRVEQIMEQPLFENQIRFEVRNALSAILVFAGYGTLIIFLLRKEVLEITTYFNAKIVLDLVLLAVWNEVHFYACHRLMHTKFFLPLHRVHHKSIVVTPYSTYSFHPLESVINGTVMILPMFLYNFELAALFLFPIYHLFFNMIGHTNIRFVRTKKSAPPVQISARHNSHHTRFHVSFGFVTPFMDRIFTKNDQATRVKKS